MDEDEELKRRQGRRLREARAGAGYRSARAAAIDNEWPESSYRAHEAGTRRIGQDDAERYAKRYRAEGVQVTAQSILFDNVLAGRPARSVGQAGVPLVGHVGAGAAIYQDVQGPLDYVPAPDGTSDHTVAVEVRGDSLGSLFENWLVYYDEVRTPPTPDLYGKLCVVGLLDGRILVKKLRRVKGAFLLVGQFGDPIVDAEIAWAARVKHMVPR